MKMKVKKLSPVLMVESIEPCIDFWTRLGFEKATEVPHENHLGFVILAKDGIEVMYQTKASVAADVPPVAASPMKGSFLFIEVSDLNAVEKALKGVTPVVPRRKTFYGADELIVREPAGNTVTFAQFGEQTG
jgi:catechol 2,3-dioxygenase-like lactoylglutathione lyase family enzyme